MKSELDGALGDLDVKVWPRCAMKSTKTDRICGRQADFLAEIPHSIGTCTPCEAWICRKCLTAVQNQVYPCRCQRCPHIFRSWHDMIKNPRLIG